MIPTLPPMSGARMGISAILPSPRRSIKDLRRSAMDPSVFVRGRGTNGRSSGTGAGAGTINEAEALFDIPGTGRSRRSPGGLRRAGSAAR